MQATNRDSNLRVMECRVLVSVQIPCSTSSEHDERLPGGVDSEMGPQLRCVLTSPPIEGSCMSTRRRLVDVVARGALRRGARMFMVSC